jgi:beta-lactamase regulating signal transducer with metallopeptidase domain
MSPETMKLIGMSLIHFLWQGAALAALASLALAIGKSATTRYWTGVATMALMVAAPLVTFVALRNAASGEPQSIAAIAPWHAPTVKSAAVSPAELAPTAPFNLPPNSLAWLVEAWFLGVILFSVRTLGGVVVVEKLRRQASLPVSEELLAVCLALQKKVGISRAVRFCQCLRVEAPAVIGWMRPVVLLPVRVLTGLSSEQLQAVIAHELAHIKRLDSFVNLFQIAAETLLFYHPAVWWMSTRIRTEREHCCDDAAINLCGNAVEYARALALMEEKRSAPALALAANASPLAARVRRLLGISEISGGMRRVGLAAGILCLSAAILAGNTLFGFVRGASASQMQSQQQTQPLPRSAGASNSVQTQTHTQAPAMIVYATRLKPGSTPAQDQDQESKQTTTQTTPAGGSFIEGMKALGLDNLSVDQLIALKVQGVTPDYIRSIRAEGLKPDVDELISMRVQGITPEYIHQMRATGLKMDNVDDLVSVKVQGVTPAYIQEMRATGLKLDSADEVVGMKVQGVTPEYVTQMRAMGFQMDSDSVISMKVQGVTPDYVNQMRATGFKMDADSVISMKVQGVTPAYVESMRALQLKVDEDDIVAMKVQGVTPEYVRSIQSLGFKPDSDEIVGMRVQGVTAEYIKALQAAGFKPSIDEIVEARVQGVTPEFIEKVKSHGFKNLTLQKIIELKQAGILD